MSDKTIMQKKVQLGPAFMKNVEKTSICIFKSGRLSLRYFEYVNALFGRLSSQHIENQQITSAKYTVLMLRVRQNERKKAFETHQKCLIALVLLIIATRDGYSRQEYLPMHRIDET